MIAIAHPLLGAEEEAAALRVLASGQLAQGEHVAKFERYFAELCHVREAVAVSSGTAALHLALLAHNIGHGDEVITTAFSFARSRPDGDRAYASYESDHTGAFIWSSLRYETPGAISRGLFSRAY